MNKIYYKDLKKHMTKAQIEKSLGRLMLKYVKVPRINVRTSINNNDSVKYSFNLLKHHKSNKFMLINPRNMAEIRLIYGNLFTHVFQQACKVMQEQVSNNPTAFLNDYRQTYMKLHRLHENKSMKLTDKNKQEFKQLPSMNTDSVSNVHSQSNKHISHKTQLKGNHQSNPNQQNLFSSNNFNGQELNPNDYKNN